MKYTITSVTYQYKEGRKRRINFDTVPYIVDDVEAVRKRLLSITHAASLNLVYEEHPTN